MNPLDARMPVPLGHELFGSGPLRVVVLNDWLCDTSTWDGARVYLDGARFTYAFADLRGYGKSRETGGRYTVEEGATDVLALADLLGWRRFAIVGHSMSTLIAFHLGQHHAERIARVVALTPPPPAGLDVDQATLTALRALSLADDATRAATLTALSGGRLSPGWVAYKAARWRESSSPTAVAGYVAMFARDGVPDRAARIRVPLLAITGEQDAPPMRQEAVTSNLSPLCDELTVVPLADSGHYPMQELPPLTVALSERFLGAGSALESSGLAEDVTAGS
jgi:pimeloyl-ACP methyl ester carboxylesterase